MNVVISRSKAEDMILVEFAPVILDLVIGLHSNLRCQEVDARAVGIRARGEAEGVGANC